MRTQAIVFPSLLCAVTLALGCTTEDNLLPIDHVDGGDMDIDADTDSDTDPGGDLAWAVRQGVNSTRNNPVATLMDGSALLAGSYKEQAVFGPGEVNETTLFCAGQEDVFLARVNPDGTLAWAKRAGGSAVDAAWDIAALSDGSSVVTGFYGEGAVFGPGEPNETVLSEAGGGDIFLARYNRDGTLAWVKRAGGDGEDVSWAIAVGADGSPVVTGTFSKTAVFGPGEANETVLTASGDRDLFVAKFALDGTLAWAKQAGGGLVTGTGVAVQSDGAIRVIGYFEGFATFGPGETNQTILTSQGMDDVFWAKYNPDGTLAWAGRAGGAATDIGLDIAVLADGSTISIGYFGQTATFGPGETDETVLVSDGNEDIFVVEHNPDGTLAWANRAGGGSTDYGFAITALSTGSALVTGHFQSTAVFGPGEPNETALTAASRGDMFTARYHPDGTLARVGQARGEWVTGGSIASFDDGSAVVLGLYSEAVTVGPGEPNETVLTAESDMELFLAKFEP